MTFKEMGAINSKHEGFRHVMKAFTISLTPLNPLSLCYWHFKIRPFRTLLTNISANSKPYVKRVRPL
jgi:hypothetical protein